MDIRKMTAEIYRSGDFLLGSILSALFKVETTDMPTAAVGMNKDSTRLSLYYNPEFFSTLTPEEGLDVLRHEAMHVAQCHLTRIGDRDPKGWNIATDMNINQYLKNIPEDCVKLERGFPEKASADTYFGLIEKEDYEESFASAGDHSMWEDISGNDALSRKIETETETRVREAAKAGDQTARKLLSVFAEKPSRDWVGPIRRMFQPSHPEVHYKANRFDKRRIYHNNEEMVPARINKPSIPRVFVAVDTSASITDEQISRFMGEISSMSRGAKVRVLMFDTEIHDEFDIKRAGSKYDVTGRGGTNFQPVFDRVCSESRDRNLIILTDGIASEPTYGKKLNVLWALTESSMGEFSFKGKVTRLDF